MSERNLHLEVLENFDISNDGEVTWYRYKMCGFRVISEADALNYYHVCLKHPEWRREHGDEGKSRERPLLLAGCLINVE